MKGSVYLNIHYILSVYNIYTYLLAESIVMNLLSNMYEN